MRRQRRSALLSGKRSLPIKIGAASIIVIVLLIILIPSGKKGSSKAETAAIREKGTVNIVLSSIDNGFCNEKEEGLEAEIARNIAKSIFNTDDIKSNLYIKRISESFMDSYFSDSSADLALLQCPQGMYSSKYAYSEPYYTDACLLIIRYDTPTDKDVDGMRIGVISGSICEKRIDSYADENKIAVTKTVYPTYELMLSDVKAGKTDACVMTGTEFARYGTSEYRTHNQQLKEISYSVVCSKENEGLIYAVNDVIEKMWESGEMDLLIKKYLGG